MEGLTQTNPQPPPASVRRWLGARHTTIGRGFLISVGFHLGVAVLLLGIWKLIPGPPPPPVKITTYRDPPSREALGLLPDGSRPDHWNPPTELAQ